MQNKEEEKHNKWLLPAIIIIIIIILLCFSFITFGKVTFGNPTLIPTGNVDIFDLNVDCPKCNTCEEFEPDISVYDDINYLDRQVNLRIFDKPAYEYDNKIAPGMYNSYQFIIRNNNKFNLIYTLEMLETNVDKINMKYRLKRDNEYVIGSDTKWVYAKELIIKEMELLGNDYHTYNLDWKWFDNDNDTYIGENSTSDYRLDVKIVARGNK